MHRYPLLSLVTLICGLICVPTNAQPTTQPRTVRVAISGGIDDNGFWEALSEKFEQRTKIHIETVSTGQKDAIIEKFAGGGIDLLTAYSSDAMVNLVADGYATNLEPWLRGELIIVGPPNDLARIKGFKSAADAVQRIIETKSPLVVH